MSVNQFFGPGPRFSSRPSRLSQPRGKIKIKLIEIYSRAYTMAGKCNTDNTSEGNQSHDAHTFIHYTEEEDKSSSSVFLKLSSLPPDVTKRDIEDFLLTAIPDDDVEVKRVTLLSSGNATAEVTGLEGIINTWFYRHPILAIHNVMPTSVAKFLP